MTTIRVFAHGRRLAPDLFLPADLDDADIEHLGIVLLVQRGTTVVSFSGQLEVRGETLPASGRGSDAETLPPQRG